MKFLINSKEYIKREIIYSLNNYKSNIIPLMTKNTNLSYEINIKELRNTIKEFYSKSEIIPSIYLLKRKFSKIIIANLYSIYYNELEDAEVNYD